MSLPVRFPLIVMAALAMAVLTCASYIKTAERSGQRTLMRVGLEDAAGRVRRGQANLQSVRQLNDATILTKARAFAKFIAEDPTLITDTNRLAEMARTLDVDELHVSDAKGILVACIPADYVGYNMASSNQSKPFMAAIGNPTFEFVQDPCEKGIVIGKKLIDTPLFQYAGVARRDVPGIVQVGQRASRVQEVQRLADVKTLAASVRIGLNGRVSVRLLAGLPPLTPGFRYETDEKGRRLLLLETDCGNYRLTAAVLDPWEFLARANVFEMLIVTDLVLFLMFLGSGVSLRRLFVRELIALKVLFTLKAGPSREVGSVLRILRSPVTLACALIFVLTIAASWFVSMRVARRDAEDVLQAAVKDMRKTLDDCVDDLLCYQGRAITRHYRTPKDMTCDTVQAVMRRYGLDELNVVNEDGIVVAGALADVGYDMGSKPITAEFNRLLNGVETYTQAFRGAVEDPKLRRKYVGIAFPPPAKGYVQLGFDESRVKDDIDFLFRNMASDWHIGESGFYVVAKAETGEIDSIGRKDIPDEAKTLTDIGFNVDEAPRASDEFFVANLCGEPCLCLSEVRMFHRIVTAMPLAEITGSSYRALAWTAAVLLLIFSVVIVFMTRLMDLVTSLKGYIAAEKQRQEKDLTLARTIQLSSLPLTFPDGDVFRIFARMDAAREVGGDFYDFYELPSGKWLLLVADVSGKGISAAMFMMKAKAIIKASVFETGDLAKAIAAANDQLSEHNDAEMFVTAWVATYDLATGEIEYVNAGHNPPLIKRAGGAVEWVRSRGGLALAAMAGVRYKTARFILKPGDSLFLYTDGVTEAMNVAGELYGEPRLEAALAHASAFYVDEIRMALAAFVAGAEQSDDITMLAFDVKDKSDKKEV